MPSCRRVGLPLLFLLATVATGSQLPAQPARADPATARVDGLVLGPLGEPMVGARVWAAIWPALDDVIARSQTDGNGMFVLSHLPQQRVSVFATAEGHTVAWSSTNLSPDRPEGGTRMRLWPANAIRGQVLDEQDEPVAGAVVLGSKDFCWLDGRFRSPEAVTDADGRFELAGVPIGDQVVRAWADGYVMREHRVVASEDHEVVVRLARGAGVRIAIRTEGVAAEHAGDVQVRIYPTRAGSGFACPHRIENDGRLGEDGTFAIAGLPDCEWNVQLRSPDYTFAPHLLRSRERGVVRDLTFRAAATGSVLLTGQLRTNDGTPLGAQRLVCRTRRGPSINGGAPGHGTTDENGRFRIVAPLVRGEPYSLHLSGSQYVLHQSKGKGHDGWTDLRYLVRYEDDADAGRSLSLTAVAATFVTAKVVDDNGSPIPFRWCELQVHRQDRWSAMAYATTRRDGTAEFPGVHALDTDVRVEVDLPVGAACSEVFRLDEPPRDLTVQVPKPGTIRGRLLAADGAPVAGARLQMQNYHVDTGERIDGSWTNVITDRDGRYAFVGVAATGHKISPLDERGDHLFTSTMIAVDAGQTVEHELRLQK